MVRSLAPALRLFAVLNLLLAPAADGAELARPSAAAAARPAELPPPAVLLALLRGTLSALNQANVTGNYSVLRDLGAPAFREAYSAAALADGFRMWRERKLDFAAVLLLDAKLTQAPAIDADGTLRLAGYFPTAPLRVEFELGFQPVAGNWRVATIKASVSDADVTGSVAGTARPQAAPAAKLPAAEKPGPRVAVESPASFGKFQDRPPLVATGAGDFPLLSAPRPPLATPPGDRPRG